MEEEGTEAQATAVQAAGQIADRRLILAIQAEPLNGLGDHFGEFVPTADLYATGVLSPEQTDPLLATCQLLQDCGVWFGPRRYLETDPAWRQLIPYVVVMRRDVDALRFLLYRRTEQAGDERMRGRLAIGLGGHMDLKDCQFNAMDELDLMRTVMVSAGRECVEEAGLSVSNPDVVGLILAKSPMVSSVHVGLVMVVELIGTILVPQEQVLTDFQWLTLDEIGRLPEEDRHGWVGLVGDGLWGWLKEQH